MMNDPQKSDGCTVAMKSANKPDGSGAESMERRRPAKGNAGESCTHRTLSRGSVTRAVVEVLNAIYEVDFLGFSYGFRPKRSQHDALDALAFGITQRRVNWIVDADLKNFLERSSHYPRVVYCASKRSG
jgi:hypothetical protein